MTKEECAKFTKKELIEKYFISEVALGLAKDVYHDDIARLKKIKVEQDKLLCQQDNELTGCKGTIEQQAQTIASLQNSVSCLTLSASNRTAEHVHEKEEYEKRIVALKTKINKLKRGYDQQQGKVETLTSIINGLHRTAINR